MGNPDNPNEGSDNPNEGSDIQTEGSDIQTEGSDINNITADTNSCGINIIENEEEKGECSDKIGEIKNLSEKDPNKAFEIAFEEIYRIKQLKKEETNVLADWYVETLTSFISTIAPVLNEENQNKYYAICMSREEEKIGTGYNERLDVRKGICLALLKIDPNKAIPYMIHGSTFSKDRVKEGKSSSFGPLSETKDYTIENRTLWVNFLEEMSKYLPDLMNSGKLDKINEVLIIQFFGVVIKRYIQMIEADKKNIS